MKNEETVRSGNAHRRVFQAANIPSKARSKSDFSLMGNENGDFDEVKMNATMSSAESLEEFVEINFVAVLHDIATRQVIDEDSEDKLHK
jgi:hypothetical protein